MPKNDSALGTPEAAARTSLTSRILAVNIFALAMLAGGFFYLDSYRSQLIDARLEETATQVRLIAEAYSVTPARGRNALLAKFGAVTDTRLRIYHYRSPRDRAAEVHVRFDSWALSGPTYRLRDPSVEDWQKQAARFLDRSIDMIVGADRPQNFYEPRVDTLAAWPLTLTAARKQEIVTEVQRAPDRTPMILAAIVIYQPHGGGDILLSTENQRDITRIVRAERLRLSVVLLFVVIVSVSLSLFLARTIVRPLRRLALAAHRVRLGRAREVQVPRLPDRRDEIGTLARALSDMSLALRQRIDATEAFAADVAHELKNPLASLRSAVDSCQRPCSSEATHRRCPR